MVQLIIVLLVASMLIGCGQTIPAEPSQPTQSEENQLTTLGLEPDLNYERPVTGAHIEVDQLGYLPKAKKQAIFRGDNLSSTFCIIDADTMDVVYTGEIKEKKLGETGKTYTYGDFSDFDMQGRFFLQTDVIGCSYPFVIKENLYDDILTEALKQFYINRCGISLTSEYAGDNARSACHSNPAKLKSDADREMDVIGGWHVNTSGDRDVRIGCVVIWNLLMAYEYNREAFETDTGIPESGNGIPDILDEIKVETDWLLKMQDTHSGAVFSAVSVVNKGNGLDNPCHVETANMEATLSFASAMAYFSYLYQGYDNAYATTCIQAADRAMKYAAKMPDDLDADMYFKAATILYRATGYYRYKQIIEEYWSLHAEFDMSNDSVFDGAVTYMATKQRTDSKLCEQMMMGLRSYAEELSGNRRDSLFLMGEEYTEVNNTTLLSEIARLTVVNYILSSNEYETVMEKYLHYFLGCNPTNTCYVGQYGSINVADEDPAKDILRQPEQDAYLILLLSGVKIR